MHFFSFSLLLALPGWTAAASSTTPTSPGQIAARVPSDTFANLKEATNDKPAARPIFPRCVQCPYDVPACPFCKPSQQCNYIPASCDACASSECVEMGSAWMVTVSPSASAVQSQATSASNATAQGNSTHLGSTSQSSSSTAHTAVATAAAFGGPRPASLGALALCGALMGALL